ncbi:MAG: hypothetical protein V7608_5369 [Hyphomicrobiales bacterium]|jgi:uncharacterized membrane protein YkoI
MRRVMRSAMLPSVLSVLLLSAAPGVSTCASESIHTAQQEPAAGGLNREEIELFRQSKVTLSEAIAAAKNHGAGQLVEASFDFSGGKPVYQVKTFQNNEVWVAAIDAQSGQLVGYGTIVAEDQLDDEDRPEVASLRQATVTLAQAVDTAEKGLNGRAMSAELEQANGIATYEITVIPIDGLPIKTTVDPKTRQLGG